MTSRDGTSRDVVARPARSLRLTSVAAVLILVMERRSSSAQEHRGCVWPSPPTAIPVLRPVPCSSRDENASAIRRAPRQIPHKWACRVPFQPLVRRAGEVGYSGPDCERNEGVAEFGSWRLAAADAVDGASVGVAQRGESPAGVAVQNRQHEPVKPILVRVVEFGEARRRGCR